MRSSIKKQSVEIKQNTTCRYASPIPAICKQSCTRGPQFNIPFRLSFIQSDYRSFQPHRIPVIPFKRNIRNVMSGPRERERERETDRETEREREREKESERERGRRPRSTTNLVEALAARIAHPVVVIVVVVVAAAAWYYIGASRRLRGFSQRSAGWNLTDEGQGDLTRRRQNDEIAVSRSGTALYRRKTGDIKRAKVRERRMEMRGA